MNVHPCVSTCVACRPATVLGLFLLLLKGSFTSALSPRSDPLLLQLIFFFFPFLPHPSSIMLKSGVVTFKIKSFANERLALSVLKDYQKYVARKSIQLDYSN